jgi:N6-adenosine-specific RNA methylase IME4
VEIEENCQRKALSQSELAKQQRVLLDIVQRGARPGTRTDLTTCENRFSPVDDRSTAIVGRLYGESHKQVEKRRDILLAAEEDPVQCGPFLEQMDRTNRVGPVHKRLELLQRQQAHAARTHHGCTVADLHALADSGQRFGVIYADPPWPDEHVDGHYGLMSVAEIADLPTPRLAAEDCALFMWVTWRHLLTGRHLEILQRWGFEPNTVAFVWVKENASGDGLHVGRGHWTLQGSEACIVATRGSPARIAENLKQVVMAPIGAHSVKPAEVRHRIERLVDGPYLELFARKPESPGSKWWVWGNEITRNQMRPLNEVAEMEQQ